jgi:hypothetical protein
VLGLSCHDWGVGAGQVEISHDGFTALQNFERSGTINYVDFLRIFNRWVQPAEASTTDTISAYAGIPGGFVPHTKASVISVERLYSRSHPGTFRMPRPSVTFVTWVLQVHRDRDRGELGQ